jgi:uncharacterized protein (TIGR03083 family)
LDMIADERRQMADLVDALTPGQLETPSLCGRWSVRDVIGHLVAPVAAPLSWVVPTFVRSAFRIHRANARIAQRMARRSPAELAAALREHADNRFKPPIVGYLGPLTDLQVHGQDIRRPLGLSHRLRPDRMRVSLDFLVGGRAVGFVPKNRPTGLRFEAIDIGWNWGTGPVVRGEAEAVMLALTGRPVVLPELDGAGVTILRDRLATG